MNKDVILLKKRHKDKLSYQELEYFFNGYINDIVSEEDMTEMLRLICKFGLSEEEIFDLTDIFIKSGSTLDLSEFKGIVDKHSTGGVGDKTTLILAPILASCNVKIAKMSGRALGYTGGTIDKLESIPGFKVNLTKEEFIKELKDINMVITSQTENLVPMDKKVYALRDVTNTTKSIALIAVSIMSKKIACGAEAILIDLKVGKGALINTLRDARILADIMIKIGEKYNRRVICLLTDMNNPLGNNIGNILEVIEAKNFLQNKVDNNLNELIIPMASILVSESKKISKKEAEQEVEKSIKSGLAYDVFKSFINYQHGDIYKIKVNSKNKKLIYANKSGYIKSINSLSIGELSMALGAGRIKKEDKIDYNAGIVLNKLVGDKVRKGDLLCTLYGKKEINMKKLYKAFEITKLKPKKKDVIIELID